MTRRGHVTAVLLAATLSPGLCQALATPQEQTTVQAQQMEATRAPQQVSEATSDEEEATSGQVDAVLQQMQHEESKHRTRVARLERIRSLLQEKGDTKGVERADKLLGKEGMRYEKKMTKLRQHNAKAAAKFSDQMSKVDKMKGAGELKGQGKAKAEAAKQKGAPARMQPSKAKAEKAQQASGGGR